jgi:molybdate transport system substrate-binding protein
VTPRRATAIRRLAALFVSLVLATPAWCDAVTVFAAASLKESLDAAVQVFRERTGHDVAVSYAGSNALARHIERGAPADLFIPADEEWAAYLEQRDLVQGTRRILATNELVLIAPAASPARVKLEKGLDLAPLLRGGRLAMANPAAVPAGRYAKAALTSLGAWSGVEARIAAAGNVRGALVLVARGEAPLGIVYRTDALMLRSVRIVGTFPAETHPAIVYPLLQVKRMSPPAAYDLAEFLASAEAGAIFRRFGFGSP